jgi:hypothetical protein
MAKGVYKMKSEVLVYPGMGGWRFLALPKKEAAEIKEKFGKVARGWGSIRVAVTVGKTKWQTSIFPDKRSGTYLLPLKAEVRRAEAIHDKDKVQFVIAI